MSIMKMSRSLFQTISPKDCGFVGIAADTVEEHKEALEQNATTLLEKIDAVQRDIRLSPMGKEDARAKLAEAGLKLLTEQADKYRQALEKQKTAAMTAIPEFPNMNDIARKSLGTNSESTMTDFGRLSRILQINAAAQQLNESCREIRQELRSLEPAERVCAVYFGSMAIIPVPIGDVGKFAEPVKTLIEKCSAFIGGVFAPMQMERLARAEAKRKKILAEADANCAIVTAKAEADSAFLAAQNKIEIRELEQRALDRFVADEARRQQNMENIMAKAIPHVKEDAQPGKMDDDWIANFFNKSANFSGDQMQELWGRILAGEANAPGTFSRRTVNALESLDAADARNFKRLCNIVFVVSRPTPLIFDINGEMYSKNHLTSGTILHLESIGLIHLKEHGSYSFPSVGKAIPVSYARKTLIVTPKIPETDIGAIPIGQAMFTAVGSDLYKICSVEEVPGFEDYVRLEWDKKGFTMSNSNG